MNQSRRVRKRDHSLYQGLCNAFMVSTTLDPMRRHRVRGFVYLAARHLLELVVPSFDSERSKEIEIITTGLDWRRTQQYVTVSGEVDRSVPSACHELGA